MAQRKIETVPDVEGKVIPAAEESITVGSFVNTFWNQYEQSRERALQLREKREDAYIGALREVIKFNKQYRRSIAKLYDQSKKTSGEVVSEIRHQFTSDKEVLNEETLIPNEREELRTQLKEVSGQLEKLVLTPVRSFFYMVDQLEDNLERNAESRVEFARESRNAWFQVRKEYVKLAKNTQLKLVDRGRNSIKELVKTH